MQGSRRSSQRSLKARALQALAQREQSRAELRRKLLAHAQADEQADEHAEAAAQRAAHETSDAATAWGEGPADAAGSGETACAPTAEARVEALLDWLEANRYLSNERFTESRVHARAPRFGNLRIRHELKQHDVALSGRAMQALAASETERARQVRERKFPSPPATAAERARQSRFLVGRGFSPDAIREAMRNLPAPDTDTAPRHGGPNDTATGAEPEIDP